MSLPWRRWTRRGRGGPACSLPVEGDRTCRQARAEWHEFDSGRPHWLCPKVHIRAESSTRSKLGTTGAYARAGGNVRPVLLGAQPMCFLRSRTRASVWMAGDRPDLEARQRRTAVVGRAPARGQAPAAPGQAPHSISQRLARSSMVDPGSAVDDIPSPAKSESLWASLPTSLPPSPARNNSCYCGAKGLRQPPAREGARGG